MALIIVFLSLLILWTRTPLSCADTSPRTFRPDFPGSSSSIWSQARENQTGQLHIVDYNSSSSLQSSSSDLPQTVTTPMNYSSMDQQYLSSSLSKPSSRLEKVCGLRTQEGWGTEEDWFYDFPKFCVLWNSSCSGNESYAKCMYHFVHPPHRSKFFGVD